MDVETLLNLFDIDSTSLENGFNIAVQQNRMNVEVKVETVCASLYE